MPIKPQNRARYPKEWPQIRAAILDRTGNRCEHPGCSARQYSVGRWLRDGAGVPMWKSHADYAETYAEARQMAAEYSFFLFGDGPADDSPVIVIVLTVAHLDHQPENCDPANLRALCQRHHLAHDHDHHRANAQATRRAKAGTMELF